MESSDNTALSEQITSHSTNELASNESQHGASRDSQTAIEYIDRQLQLEADAREALPYAFDHCTNPLGALRQNLFSCLTCNPPPESPSGSYTAAGICYSCSIACHGEHELVELFNRRNFTCDCGTTRLPSSSPCTLRIDPATGTKGPVHSQAAAKNNTYNQNFRNRFCGCGEIYNAHEEKGTMFQCLGLATEEDGGCGEDWWHPECVLGLGRDWSARRNMELGSDAVTQATTNQEETPDMAQPLPPGFPQEEEFEAFICYKCVEMNPWIKAYAGTQGFLRPVFKSHKIDLRGEFQRNDEKINAPTAQTHENQTAEKQIASEIGENAQISAQAPTHKSSDEISQNQGQKLAIVNPEEISTNGELPLSTSSPQSITNESTTSKKRKAQGSLPDSDNRSESKKPKINLEHNPYHESLSSAPTELFSLFGQEDFREHFCRCATCYSHLRKHPQLLEEEESYEPPLSENEEEGGQSVGTGSLLDRGEAALSNVDRVRAIEGVMVYNHLKDKVKNFLQPFAESGQPVGAEDIKAYFEKLRGDDQAIKAAGGKTVANGGNDAPEGSQRREQNGY